MKPCEKLNKTFVENLPFAESGQVFYWDSKLLGFGLYIGVKSKTWFVEKRIEGKATSQYIRRTWIECWQQSKDLVYLIQGCSTYILWKNLAQVHCELKHCPLDDRRIVK